MLPNFVVSLQNYFLAHELVKNIDRKDMFYVAYALELDATLLTRDKPLAIGLRANGFTNVVLLEELISE